MKFQHGPYPANGETRITREFLWLPLRLNNETRWLETASWKEVYVRSDPARKGHWAPVMWWPFHLIK